MLDRLSDAIRMLEREGLQVIQARRGGHHKVYHGARLVAVLSKNMNDARGWKNTLARIRRATGLELR